MLSNLRPPPELEIGSPQLATRWRTWRREWENYAIAVELTGKPHAVQVAVFLNCAGGEAQEVASHFSGWSTEQGLDELVSRFEAFCVPRQNVVRERYNFYTRGQKPDESVSQYLSALRSLAATCAFPDQDNMLRDRLCIGVSNRNIQAALLKRADLTLQMAIDIALSEEAANRDVKVLGKEPQSEHVDLAAVSEPNRPQSPRKCKFCGREHAMIRSRCPAWGKVCLVCGQANHFACSTVCNSRRPPPGSSRQRGPARQFAGRPAAAAAATVGAAAAGRAQLTADRPGVPPTDSSGATEPWDVLSSAAIHPGETPPSKAHKTLVTVAGNPVTFLIDSGSECDVLTWDDYVRVTNDAQGVRLRPCHTALRMYDGALVTCEGKRSLCFVNPLSRRKHTLQCKVVNSAISSILSLTTSVELGLIDVRDCDPLDYVPVPPPPAASPAVDNATDMGRDLTSARPSALTPRSGCESDDQSRVKAAYQDVFDKGSVGLVADNYEIVTDPSAVPVVEAPRRVRVHIREKLKKKLDDLEALGVISHITEPTDWVSNPVIVDKPNGDIRLCIDPRFLNRAVRREHYPTPTVDEVTARMTGAKVFSLVDASCAFWQIGLSARSARLCCFHTPFGRYIWNRLPYGVKCSSEIWQRMMHELIMGLEGVEVIADDFVVFGRGNTRAEAEQDHNRNLAAFLARARERNLRLNPDKFRYKVTELKWMGHVLSAGGLKPDPAKVSAVREYPPPSDVPSLKRFLGMVSFLARYIPNLSQIVAPLRQLTQASFDWYWSPWCETAFKTIQHLLTTAPVLKYYDPHDEATVQCDASSHGLGAVLMQRGNPVMYCSRSLTVAERAYSQIEKELLAITFALTRLDQYLYGRPVTVETDHKPLVAIHNKPLSDAPLRLQRMLLTLQRYNFHIVYRPGSEIPVADALSRAPIQQSPSLFAMETESLALSSGIAVSPERLEAIRAAYESDPVLPRVIQQALSGWPEHRRQLPDALRPYHGFHDELFTQDGLLYKGRCVVIPTSLQQDLISRLHRTHIGLSSILRLARQNVFWIGMTSMLKDAILRCPTCLAHRPAQTAEPLLSHEVPSRPWTKLGTDIFELNGSMYLVLVDYYSNFMEIDRLTRTTVDHVTSALSAQFARYGIPETLVSDNGPPFSSCEFRAFLRSLDIHHVTSSPGYPQSNGKAENAVKTAKALMRKAIASGENPLWALLTWRNSPSEGSDMSPAQKMFGRACRTFLPTPRSNLLPTYPTPPPRVFADNKLRQAKYYNRRTRPLTPLVVGQPIRMRLPGQRTWSPGVCTGRRIRMGLPGQRTWSPGVCTGTAGPRSYWVRVNDVTYRRNRRQLLATTDPLPVQRDRSDPDPLGVPREPAAPPALPPTSPVSTGMHPSVPPMPPGQLRPGEPSSPARAPSPPAGVPLAPVDPADPPQIISHRPQRHRHPPAYLSDYER